LQFVPFKLVLVGALLSNNCGRPGNQELIRAPANPLPAAAQPLRPPDHTLAIPLAPFTFPIPTAEGCINLLAEQPTTMMLKEVIQVDGNIEEWKGEVASRTSWQGSTLFVGYHAGGFAIGTAELPGNETWTFRFISSDVREGKATVRSERAIRWSAGKTFDYRDGQWQLAGSDAQFVIGSHFEGFLSDRLLLSVAQSPVWGIEWVKQASDGTLKAATYMLPSLLVEQTATMGVRHCQPSEGGERAGVWLDASFLGVDPGTSEKLLSQVHLAKSRLDRHFQPRSNSPSPLSLIFSPWQHLPEERNLAATGPSLFAPAFVNTLAADLQTLGNVHQIATASQIYSLAELYLKQSFPTVDRPARHIFAILVAMEVLENEFGPDYWILASRWAFWDWQKATIGKPSPDEIFNRMTNQTAIERWAIMLAFHTTAAQQLHLIDTYGGLSAMDESSSETAKENSDETSVLKNRLADALEMILHRLGRPEPLNQFGLALQNPELVLPQGPQSPQDYDHDGIADGIEAKLGTDPNRSDSDSDSWTDLGELLHGSDPVNDSIRPKGIAVDGSMNDWFRLVPSPEILHEDIGINENCRLGGDITRFAAVLSTQGLLLAIAINDEALDGRPLRLPIQIDIRTGTAEIWFETSTGSQIATLRDASARSPNRAMALLAPVGLPSMEFTIGLNELGLPLDPAALGRVEVRFRTRQPETLTDCDDTPWVTPVVDPSLKP
jgi:hypothetical protein